MSYYTFEEIDSQASVWKSVIDLFDNKTKELEKNIRSIKNHQNIFVGCGTSYYLSQSAACVFSKITKNCSRAFPGSDSYLFPELLFPNYSETYSIFFVSRSGKTTETIEAVKFLQHKFNIKSNGISCRKNSELIKNVENKYVISDGDEKSVVMTRSFTSMLLLIQELAGYSVDDHKFINELRKLPELGEKVLKQYSSLSEKIIEDGSFSHFVYLGQGPFYGLANESMLKIKEMSLTYSEAYQTLEYRHGPKSMVNDKMLVTFFVSEKAKDAEVKLMGEVKKLGAKVLAICEKSNSDIQANADYIIELNSGLNDYARLILYMPITQLLGYYQSIKKGLNPDRPENLDQVVEI